MGDPAPVFLYLYLLIAMMQQLQIVRRRIALISPDGVRTFSIVSALTDADGHSGGMTAVAESR